MSDEDDHPRSLMATALLISVPLRLSAPPSFMSVVKVMNRFLREQKVSFPLSCSSTQSAIEENLEWETAKARSLCQARSGFLPHGKRWSAPPLPNRFRITE